MTFKITDELVQYCDFRLEEISEMIEYLYEIKKEKSKIYKELLIQEETFEEIKEIVGVLKQEEAIEKMYKKITSL